ncbi:MAG: hypothetical protein ACYC6A_00840 [Armatimonadota bacterium]
MVNNYTKALLKEAQRQARGGGASASTTRDNPARGIAGRGAPSLAGLTSETQVGYKYFTVGVDAFDDPNVILKPE